jgi:hypothetical protein
MPEKNAFFVESQNMAFLKGIWLLTLEAGKDFPTTAQVLTTM